MTTTVTPVHAGPGALDYFLRQQGCGERDRKVDLERGAVEREAEGAEREAGKEPGREQEGSLGYFTDHAGHDEQERGEPAGVWLGSGLAEFGFNPGDEISEDDARAVFERLEHPKTGEALGARHRKYKSAEVKLREALEREPDATPERREELKWQIRGQVSSPVAYWDIAFSAPKSVSVLYAALAVEGRYAEAERVWEAHREGAAAALSYVEDKAGWSRRGYHGKAQDGRSVGEWVAANQWTAVRFDHTTSRTGDPQIHSHVLVPNRVQCADTDKYGQRKWRSVDGKGLYQVKRAADAVYQRTMFEALHRDLGTSAVERVDGNGWEIEGIDQEVCEAFSSRRGQIEQVVARYIADYTETHGKPPEARELFMMYKTASLNTRPPKPEPQTREEREAGWRATPGFSSDALVDQAVGRRLVDDAEREPESGWAPLDRQRVIAAAVEEVQSRRASWTAQDLEAAINMRLQIDSTVPAAERAGMLAGLVAEAVAPGGAAKVVGLVPPEVVITPAAARRAEDGLSRFSRPMPDRFATEDQLAAEDSLLAAAKRGGAPALSPSQIEAVREDIRAAGLNSGQRAAVEGILASDRQIDVLIGPAGTGKSFTVAALSEVWQREHGAPVLGLATSQIATDVLNEDGLDAINTSKFLGLYEPDPRTGLPEQILEPNTLLIVDETGMAATGQLGRIQRIAEAAGAKLLFTGDHEQLDAVGAGGALRQLAGDVPTFTLDEVVRFNQDWEREASLGLREGQAMVLRDYDAHGRLFEGDETAMVGQAKDMFLATRLRGEASLLIVPRNDQAAQLSGELRAQLQAYGVVSTDDLAVAALRDGNRAGVGDLIQTRRNDWRTRTTNGRPVVNRDIWRVLEHRDDGSLRVEKIDARGRATAGGEVTLTPDYLGKHATLAYAVTNHAAQGVTVGQSINVYDVASTRSQIYVGMTRGRDGNWAFVVTRAEVDDEKYLEPLRSDRFAVLTHALEQDTAQRTATDTLRAELEHAEGIAQLGTAWRTLGDEHNRDRYCDILRSVLTPAEMDRLDDEDGVARFLRAVRSAELAGRIPERLLPSLVNQSPLGDARSVSDVLRHRLHAELGEAPQPISTSWVGRTHGVSRDGLGGDLGRFQVELAMAMDRREQALGERVADDPPAWALAAPALGALPEDPVARVEWVARAGAVAACREWIGAHDLPETVALGPAPSRENPDARAVWERAYSALGAPADQRDYARAGDAELQAMVERYHREQAWAPTYVADLLRKTEQRLVRFQTKETLEAQHLSTLTDPAERATSQARLDSHHEQVTRLVERAGAYREIHEARQGWYAETELARHHAEHAARELDRRQALVPERASDPETTEPPRGEGGRVVEQVEQNREPIQTPQEQYRELSTRAREAQQVRAEAHAEFVAGVRRAETEQMDRLDPEGSLDPAGRAAAARAENLARTVAAVRAEHGDRLDPEGQRDDLELLSARAVEIAHERDQAEQARAVERAATHERVDPRGVLDESARDALAWAERHRPVTEPDLHAGAPQSGGSDMARAAERVAGPPERGPQRHTPERDQNAEELTPQPQDRQERETQTPREGEHAERNDQVDQAVQPSRVEPEQGAEPGRRFPTSEALQAGVERARAARERVDAQRAERARTETERHAQRARSKPEQQQEQRAQRESAARNPWARSEQQRNPYERFR
ncbi:MobF family relaxase [Actinomycetospora termitidis]|uniref:MobF family relaxase n=1 Tax=Actinomycetospora termitidis TaxID=3053470 RepID=A0ABT7MJ57_9PSEU|nr:MobF family relaxase [Actinomycetospora sp. Odt1-22]MDL5160496.1 MobF family relaxase [Actinomycetospora sp. Odt1-22]